MDAFDVSLHKAPDKLGLAFEKRLPRGEWAERISQAGSRHVGEPDVSGGFCIERFRAGREDPALNRAALQGGEYLRAGAGLKNGDVFVRLQVPFLQQIARNEVRSRTDAAHAEFGSLQLACFLDRWNGPQFER